MEKRFQIVGIGLICLLLIMVVGAGRSLSLTHAIDTEPCVLPRMNSQPPEEESREMMEDQTAHDREAMARINELAHLKNEQERRGEAAKKTSEFRGMLQRLHHAGWASLIQTNLPALMKLREEAAGTPSGETPCTLCDGKGAMHFCILCQKHNGKCLTCLGTGRLNSEQYCPTCQANGKCFLCFGTGRMPCPFCYDGMIEAKPRLPKDRMPIE